MKRLALAALLSLTACGDLPEPTYEDAGTPCLGDEDCVPDACCGVGQNAVHVSEGPSCASITCETACDVTQVRCGCGVPVCRDSRCTVAVAVDPSCG